MTVVLLDAASPAERLAMSNQPVTPWTSDFTTDFNGMIDTGSASPAERLWLDNPRVSPFVSSLAFAFTGSTMVMPPLPMEGTSSLREDAPQSMEALWTARRDALQPLEMLSAPRLDALQPLEALGSPAATAVAPAEFLVAVRKDSPRVLEWLVGSALTSSQPAELLGFTIFEAGLADPEVLGSVFGPGPAAVELLGVVSLTASLVFEHVIVGLIQLDAGSPLEIVGSVASGWLHQFESLGSSSQTVLVPGEATGSSSLLDAPVGVERLVGTSESATLRLGSFGAVQRDALQSLETLGATLLEDQTSALETSQQQRQDAPSLVEVSGSVAKDAPASLESLQTPGVWSWSMFWPEQLVTVGTTRDQYVQSIETLGSTVVQDAPPPLEFLMVARGAHQPPAEVVGGAAQSAVSPLETIGGIVREDATSPMESLSSTVREDTAQPVEALVSSAQPLPAPTETIGSVASGWLQPTEATVLLSETWPLGVELAQQQGQSASVPAEVLGSIGEGAGGQLEALGSVRKDSPRILEWSTSLTVTIVLAQETTGLNVSAPTGAAIEALGSAAGASSAPLETSSQLRQDAPAEPEWLLQEVASTTTPAEAAGAALLSAPMPAEVLTAPSWSAALQLEYVSALRQDAPAQLQPSTTVALGLPQPAELSSLARADSGAVLEYTSIGQVTWSLPLESTGGLSIVAFASQPLEVLGGTVAQSALLAAEALVRVGETLTLQLETRYLPTFVHGTTVRVLRDQRTVSLLQDTRLYTVPPDSAGSTTMQLPSLTAFTVSTPPDNDPFTFDFSQWLATISGDTLATVSVAITNADGTAQTSLISPVQSMNAAATMYTVWLTGGVAGTTYTISLTVTTVQGRTSQKSVDLTVVQFKS